MVPSIEDFSFNFSNQKFPMLDAEEEYMLAKNWRENGNLQSAHKLVTSHLRLVVNYRIQRIWFAGKRTYFRGKYWIDASG